MSASSLN